MFAQSSHQCIASRLASFPELRFTMNSEQWYTATACVIIAIACGFLWGSIVGFVLLVW